MRGLHCFWAIDQVWICEEQSWERDDIQRLLSPEGNLPTPFFFGGMVLEVIVDMCEYVLEKNENIEKE
jgi:hypothetical protein